MELNPTTDSLQDHPNPLEMNKIEDKSDFNVSATEVIE
jgi:hypothetical protein